MNTILKLPLDDIIYAIQHSKTKTDVFTNLLCYRNSKNIKELNNIIQKYSLKLGSALTSSLKLESALTSSLKIDTCNCKYCGKSYKLSGIRTHELYCKLNPNKKICVGNKGHTKGYKIWNKGLTAKTSDSVRQQADALKTYYKTHTCYNLGLLMSDEERTKRRIGMIKYLNNIPNFNGPHYNKNSGLYIENLNKDMNWNLLYFANGGEVCIDGYYLDGYDKELNIAFEYDEPRHYKDIKNSILKDKDIYRLNYIINKLNCRFFRYNESMNYLYEVK